MNKKSYKNKLYLRKKRLDSLIEPVPAEEGLSSGAKGIGRGLFLPGEQAVPAETDDFFFAEKRRRSSPMKRNEILDLLVELGDGLDESGEYRLASFADFLIKKIAEQEPVDHQKLLQNLIVNIYNSDLQFVNNLIAKIVLDYNKKFMDSVNSGESKQEAHRAAYLSATSMVEEYA